MEHRFDCFPPFTGTFAVMAVWGLCLSILVLSSFKPELGAVSQPLPISIFLEVKENGPVSVWSEMALHGWRDPELLRVSRLPLLLLGALLLGRVHKKTPLSTLCWSLLLSEYLKRGHSAHEWGSTVQEF